MAIDRDALPYSGAQRHQRYEAESASAAASASSGATAPAGSTGGGGGGGAGGVYSSFYNKIMGGSQPAELLPQQQRGASGAAPAGGSMTPNLSSGSLHSTEASGSGPEDDLGGPSSSRITNPLPSTDSTTPLEVEAGEFNSTGEPYGAGSAGASTGHPGFFGKDSVAKRRARRRGPAKWTDYLPCRLTRRQMALCSIGGIIVLIIAIVLVTAAAKRARLEQILPGGDEAAAETGVYRNAFTEYLGKTEADVDKKLAAVWKQLFYGDPETEAVYVEVEPDMAQIINTESNVVTSEGISYGMISCVHMEKQEEFNKLWNWARFHMQQTAGDYEAFFAWRVTRGGLLIDAKDVIPAPDAEAYIATALIAAHRKWGSTDAYPYKAEALRLLEAMGDPRKGFFTREGKATFNPTDWGRSHSNPSYHLPHFYEVFARFLANEGEGRKSAFWRNAARQSRVFFHRAAHRKTGLMPDYTTLEGKKAPDPNLGGHANFQWDAWRAPANVAVDWAWWNADGWQRGYADRLLGFFKAKGPNYESLFTVDGKEAEPRVGHDLGLASQNAVVSLAAKKGDKLPVSFVGELWDQKVPEGGTRYYSAMLYMMSLLHCSGKFKAYF